MVQYTKSANDKFLNEHLTVGWPWRMFVFTIVVFLVAIFGYLGLAFGYKPYLQNSIADVESKLNGLALQVSSDSQKSFIGFYSQIANLKSLLSEHVITSKVFPLLEDCTQERVAYSAVTLVSEEHALKIEGFAESYKVLAAQLALYEQAPWVEKVILDNSSLSDRTVKFGARLIIRDETFSL